MIFDLSQNEFEGVLALALEGNGLPQGLCKLAARQGLAMAMAGQDPTDIVLGWTARDVIAALGADQAAQTLNLDRITCVREENWLRLKSLAVRTYVPESESSKIAGAGAGTHDND